MTIVSGPPPTLGEGTAATAAYRAFLAAALAKQPAERPSAGRLLGDPFVAARRRRRPRAP